MRGFHIQGRVATKQLLPCVLAGLLGCASVPRSAQTSVSVDRPRPNILWIVAEDASPHIGCYGETAIRTPHLDVLAAEGVRFDRAMVTGPVCSPSRSAMITGMYQTTLGAHNHRSQTREGKGGGNQRYYDSYVLPVQSVPELFREAGYYVANAGEAKEDYNFVTPRPLYDKGDWSDRPDKSRPFFCQIQLQGGKARGARVADPVRTDAFSLPPYYPDTPVIRRDWAQYLNTWVKTDAEVGEIIERLRSAGELEKTVIFFWTDHGISHLRGKQFLYDEGMRVPLIVRFGDSRRAGAVRSDLVQQIDIAATSLSLAGITVPANVQGRDIFAPDYKPRSYAFAARDRCDETVDTIRAVRSDRYKYIRNFMSWMPAAQPNAYKDAKEIVREMRKMYAAGSLSELQARPFVAPRPTEELYDLQADPHETINLAGRPDFRDHVREMRQVLYRWMEEAGDPGLVPEPILEDMGRRHGSKYAAMNVPENRRLISSLISIIEAGESADRSSLRQALRSNEPAIRYWAATWLGVLQDAPSIDLIRARTQDDCPAVRVAAALALCRLGSAEDGAELLAKHINNDNLIVGMYAIRGLEQIGPEARAQLPAIVAAQESPYDFTRRFARRLIDNLTAPGQP